ncbi:MAG: SRPBCC family protein [Rhodanobacteraceae bacterium]
MTPKAINATAINAEYGVVTEPATLTLHRVLPGPIKRAWDYLTVSDLRRQWLAEGEMPMEVGSAFELVWHNDELTTPPGQRPEGFGGEHRMSSVITACDPPHTLAFTWGSTGGVSFELREQGQHVLLTLTHRRILDPELQLKISAGWHGHLDVLVARANGVEPAPFWDTWLRLKGDYAARLAGRGAAQQH